MRICPGTSAAVLALAGALACTPREAALPDDNTTLASPRTLAGVTGAWSDTTLDGSALVVNGERWSGSTDSTSLAESARALFGGADPMLLAAWRTTSAFPVAVARDVTNFGSGTLRVGFNLLGGASDQNAGIVFGLEPNGEYHYIRYNTRDGNLAVWQFIDGERQVIHHGEVHRQLPLNQWHELVVTIDGAVVSGRIAGDTTIAVSHTLPAPPVGRVGLWVKRDAITAFRDFRAVPR